MAVSTLAVGTCVVTVDLDVVVFLCNLFFYRIFFLQLMLTLTLKVFADNNEIDLLLLFCYFSETIILLVAS